MIYKMFKINLYHILCIYFLLNQNLINAVTENNNSKDTKFVQGKALLINPEEYILNVVQEFVYELEEYGFCSYKLSNFTHNIDQFHYFGRIVKGKVYYKNGFIGTVNEISLLQNLDSGTLDNIDNTATFTLKLHMLNLMTFFDFTADLSETKFSGTVAIPLTDITFSIWIKKYFYSNYIEHNVTIDSHYLNNIPVVWFYEPSNSYTQVINRYAEVLDIKDDLDVIATKYWNKFLGKVVNKIPFPELCLFCTQ